MSILIKIHTFFFHIINIIYFFLKSKEIIYEIFKIEWNIKKFELKS